MEVQYLGQATYLQYIVIFFPIRIQYTRCESLYLVSNVNKEFPVGPIPTLARVKHAQVFGLSRCLSGIYRLNRRFRPRHLTSLTSGENAHLHCMYVCAVYYALKSEKIAIYESRS